MDNYNPGQDSFRFIECDPRFGEEQRERLDNGKKNRQRKSQVRSKRVRPCVRCYTIAPKCTDLRRDSDTSATNKGLITHDKTDTYKGSFRTDEKPIAAVAVTASIRSFLALYRYSFTILVAKLRFKL